jgi:hypothetical protein
MKRRDFLHATGLALGGLLGTGMAGAGRTRKLIIVIFGGGARFSETMGDPERRHIPRLAGEMTPRGTLFDRMRVEGTVVHPNCTASILTGHEEWADLDWARPPDHPTVFEIHRRARGAPDTSAWAFVYASILSRAGESRAEGYGPGLAANVVMPPTIPRSAAEEMGAILSRASARGSPEAEVEASRECGRIARTASRLDLGGLRSSAARELVEERYASWKAGTGTTSHDAFLAGGAIECMRMFSPDVLAVAFGEIDCAHYGSWSRYVEAIRRTDELTWRIWRAAEEIEAYRGRTLLLVLPDHGRELERPGGTGFIHHGDFYTGAGVDEGCRRVWMLALGSGIAAGRRIDEPFSIRSAAATGLEHIGLDPSPGAAASLLGLARA